MPNAKTENTIEEIVKELLENLKVTNTVTIEKLDDENYKVQVNTEETGLLIGYHGEVINSLQLILGILVYRKLGKWVRVLVDVGDYRLKREELIKKMALEKAEEAKATGLPVALPYLSPLERRIVHMTLSENSSVISSSEGEGKERRVIIKPKTE